MAKKKKKVIPVIKAIFIIFHIFEKQEVLVEQKQASSTKTDLLIINTRRTQHMGLRPEREPSGLSMKCP